MLTQESLIDFISYRTALGIRGTTRASCSPHQSPIHAHFLFVLHHLNQWHRNMPYHFKIRDLDNNSSWFLHHTKNQWYTYKKTYSYVVVSLDLIISMKIGTSSTYIIDRNWTCRKCGVTSSIFWALVFNVVSLARVCTLCLCTTTELAESFWSLIFVIKIILHELQKGGIFLCSTST